MHTVRGSYSGYLFANKDKQFWWLTAHFLFVSILFFWIHKERWKQKLTWLFTIFTLIIYFRHDILETGKIKLHVWLITKRWSCWTDVQLQTCYQRSPTWTQLLRKCKVKQIQRMCMFTYVVLVFARSATTLFKPTFYITSYTMFTCLYVYLNVTVIMSPVLL